MTEDAKDLVALWRQYVEQNAARLETGDERKASYAELLRLVDDSIRIIDNYEKLVTWVGDVTTVDPDGTIRVDQAKLDEHPAKVQDLGYFDSGGVAYLLGAVWEAVKVGGHAFKDPKLEQKIQKRMKDARDRRPSNSDEIKRRAMLAEMHNQGEDDVGVIAQRLGITKDATRKLRGRMFDDGSIQERDIPN